MLVLWVFRQSDRGRALWRQSAARKKASCHSSLPSWLTDKVDHGEMSALRPCPSNTRTSSQLSVGSDGVGEGVSRRWRGYDTDMAWLGREWVAATESRKNVEAMNAKCDPQQKRCLASPARTELLSFNHFGQALIHCLECQ